MPARLCLLTGLVAVAGSPALANCPVGEDLSDGIYVTYDDDSVTKYTGEKDAAIREETTYLDDSGDTYIVTTLSGLFKTGYWDGPGGQIDENTAEAVVYADDLTAHVPVTAGQQFATEATTTYADGSEPNVERYSVLVGQPKDQIIAGCPFSVLPVTHTYADGGDIYAIAQDYVPALGIAIYTGFSELGGEPEVYQVLEISSWAPKP